MVVMVFVALGSIVIGLTLAYTAARWLPRRLPSRPLVLSTGPGAALLGALLAQAVLGTEPVHAPASLAVACGFAVALLSLLVRPARGAHRSAPA
ncbi:hypothetical protein RKE29_06025 [Streptomyces sp. B1866]|uniref:hypothetical protein n=1 Tax=Streptomyces sp. B1866 TaxID=3075431 RepID=UPI002890E0FF|nr:hypothetical protein [Streptomyces sp. B1866]MDT3396197.1 hypothetical protein [Streptomyces sp. B1866]